VENPAGFFFHLLKEPDTLGPARIIGDSRIQDVAKGDGRLV
jgi:hypothetical protein